MGLFDTIAHYGGAAWNSLSGLGDESKSAVDKRNRLNQQAAAAGGFADQAQQGYGALTDEAAQSRDYLRRLASGEESIAKEQLRQGLQQQNAAQRSMAASASPSNSAMAARTAAIQMGRAGTAMAGNAALAGIQERQAANQALANMILQQRGQDVQAALGSRGNAITGYGGVTPEGSWLQKYGPAVQGGLSGLALLSDRRLKTEVDDGEPDANAALKGLRAYTYKYKDQRHGNGKQVGIMAQDLEKAGLKHAVMDTPIGKAVHAGKLAGANTAMLAALEKRVAKIEGKGK